jgi:hypothetical protein
VTGTGIPSSIHGYSEGLSLRDESA